jgi:hypothetical protein
MRQAGWAEFRATGLLWWLNRSLHLFGWAIVLVVERDGSVSDCYPARVGFRGFDAMDEAMGFAALTNYMKQQSEELSEEVARSTDSLE